MGRSGPPEVGDGPRLLVRLFGKTRVCVGPCLVSIGGAFEEAGRRLERGRGEWLARYGYLVAAKIDLAFPTLQLIGAKPFNGQINRVRLFHSILDACHITSIIETGTFRGTTTEFMGQNFKGKIFSCEVNRRYYEYAMRRLRQSGNVEVHLMNSEQLLESLFGGWLQENEIPFFYLDAHWNTNVPLLGEVSLILKSRIPAVVMIDDFEVPTDPGYGYDTFGHGKKLSLHMLSSFRERLGYAYFPALPAMEETGARRGCLVFATSVELDRQLEAMPGLTRVTQDDWNFHG